MSRTFHLPRMLLLALVLPLLSSPPAAGQDELVQRGNLLYQEGDFSGALAAYEAVLEAGFESGDLYYNLGNAYFKTGDLGRSILSYERALLRKPRDPDARANLELARSLTADEIEPLPRFWLLGLFSWWVKLIPAGVLILLVVTAYLVAAGALLTRVLSRRPEIQVVAIWVMMGSAFGFLLFGSTLLAEEGLLNKTEWGIVMVEEVAVQSAPSDEDNLTLFRIHEGTKVRLDQRTDVWSEVVLEDGKVGWVPSGVLEII